MAQMRTPVPPGVRRGHPCAVRGPVQMPTLPGPRRVAPERPADPRRGHRQALVGLRPGPLGRCGCAGSGVPGG
eukprot:8332006-Alexandrium_andersonii.AAC.1